MEVSWADILRLSKIRKWESSHVSSAQPRRRQAAPRRKPAELDPSDPLAAFDATLAPVRSLDDLAQQFPDRDLSLSRRRAPLEMYSSEENPNAFALDSLEFFLVISQYFREALPLRLIFLLIACQRAGGRIELTQDEMAKVLDVSRQAVNESLQEIMTHGIVYKRSRGVYQFNPPYSYRIGELVRTMDGGKKYVRVEQDEVINEVRRDTSLPDLVRFPSLDHLRRAVEEMRAERAERRSERKKARQAAEQPVDGLWELPGAAEEGMAQ
ncbi:hypothetical protein [Streptomyces chartreusis]|uniref:hypothetical protein n=1 Tax=Streptomyces chartreusis TaxID=1969 RepID=UPI0019A05159|nr:hypothetical protein [Streptomyces chartreusis]GGX57735.1 hypothetical protein GCM10010321_88370 [Streptomyces chartreusis]